MPVPVLEELKLLSCKVLESRSRGFAVGSNLTGGSALCL